MIPSVRLCRRAILRRVEAMHFGGGGIHSYKE